jgi:intracellular septation protein A
VQRTASFGYRAERIFVLVAVQIVGLGLTLLIARPGDAGHEFGGARLFWLMTVALVVVAGTGAVWLRRTEARTSKLGAVPQISFGRIALPSEVVLPSMLVAGFALILQIFETGVVQALVLTLAAVALAAVFWAQTHAVNAGDRYFALSQSVLNVLSHLAAFLVFSIIYGLKERALVSASAVGLVTTLLILELLLRDVAWRQAVQRQVTRPSSSIVLLAVAAGIVLAELTWGLNYWAALTTMIGGAFLLVAFYVVYGLMSHYVEEKLDRQTFVEFGTVGAVAMLVIFGSAFISNG